MSGDCEKDARIRTLEEENSEQKERIGQIEDHSLAQFSMNFMPFFVGGVSLGATPLLSAAWLLVLASVAAAFYLFYRRYTVAVRSRDEALLSLVVVALVFGGVIGEALRIFLPAAPHL
jgi:hypothetical protein